MPFLIGWTAGPPLVLSDTELNSKLSQLFLLDLGGRAAHRVDARLVLRERDHVTQVRLAAERHQHPLDAERDPPVRRRTHREGVEQEAELAPLLLLAELEGAEDGGLELRLVDPEGAAADLDPVDDEVVRERRRRSGIGRHELLGPGRGAGERVVYGLPPALVLVPLEHRE